MNMKKYIKLMVLSLGLLIVFTGCSSQKADDGDMAVDVKTEIANEDEKATEESENIDEEMMLIDVREMVSSIFDGEFPVVIVSNDSKVTDIEKETTFAIALEENPSTGYTWRLIKNEFTESLGDGFLDVETEELLVGTSGTHYYGFKALKTGDIKIEFELVSPSAEVEEVKVFTLNSK